MHLLALYTVIVVIGTTAAAGIGLLLDPVSEILSLTVFFILFFGLLWGAWVVSVWITGPKGVAKAADIGAQEVVST